MVPILNMSVNQSLCSPIVIPEKDRPRKVQEAIETRENLCAAIFEEKLNKINEEYNTFAAAAMQELGPLEDDVATLIQFTSLNENIPQPNTLNAVIGFTRQSVCPTNNPAAIETFLSNAVDQLDSSTESESIDVDLQIADTCIGSIEQSKITELFSNKKKKIQSQMSELVDKIKQYGEETDKLQTLRKTDLQERNDLQTSALQTCRHTQRIEYELVNIRAQICRAYAKCNCANHFCCKSQMDRISALQERLENARAEAIKKEFDLQICRDAETRLIQGNEVLKEDIKGLLNHAQEYANQIVKMQQDICNGGGDTSPIYPPLKKPDKPERPESPERSQSPEKGGRVKELPKSKSPDKQLRPERPKRKKRPKRPVSSDSEKHRDEPPEPPVRKSPSTSSSSSLLDLPMCPLKNPPPSPSSTTQCSTPSGDYIGIIDEYKREDRKREDRRHEDRKRDGTRQEDPRREHPRREDPKRELPRHDDRRREDSKSETPEWEAPRRDDRRRDEIVEDDLREDSRRSKTTEEERTPRETSPKSKKHKQRKYEGPHQHEIIVQDPIEPIVSSTSPDENNDRSKGRCPEGPKRHEIVVQDPLVHKTSSSSPDESYEYPTRRHPEPPKRHEVPVKKDPKRPSLPDENNEYSKGRRSDAPKRHDIIVQDPLGHKSSSSSPEEAHEYRKGRRSGAPERHEIVVQDPLGHEESSSEEEEEKDEEEESYRQTRGPERHQIVVQKSCSQVTSTSSPDENEEEVEEESDEDGSTDTDYPDDPSDPGSGANTNRSSKYSSSNKGSERSKSTNCKTASTPSGQPCMCKANPRCVVDHSKGNLPRISEESDGDANVVEFHEGIPPKSHKQAKKRWLKRKKWIQNDSQKYVAVEKRNVELENVSSPRTLQEEIMHSYQTQNVQLTEAVNTLTARLNATQNQLKQYLSKQDQNIIDKSKAENLAEQIEILKEQNKALLLKNERDNRRQIRCTATNDANIQTDGFQTQDGKLLSSSNFQYTSRIENLETLISNLSLENESNFRDCLESKNMLSTYKKDIKRCVQELTKPAESFQLLGEPTEASGQREWAEFSKKALQVARAAKQASERQELAIKVIQKERDKLLSENDDLWRKLDIYSAVQKQFLNTYFGPELKSRLDLLSKDVEKYKSLAEKLEIEKKDLKKKYDQALGDQGKHVKRIHELDRQLKTITQSNTKDIAKLKEENNSMLQKISAKESQEKKLQEQILSSTNTLGEYKAKINKYEIDLGAARDIIEKLMDSNNGHGAHASSTEAVLRIDNGYTSKNLFQAGNSSQYVSQASSFAQVVQHHPSGSQPARLLSACKSTSPFGGETFRNELAKINASCDLGKALFGDRSDPQRRDFGDDPQLQTICSKILDRGLEALDFKALVYLHYAVYNAGVKYRKELGSNVLTRESSSKRSHLKGKQKSKAAKLSQIERDMHKTKEILKYLQRHA